MVSTRDEEPAPESGMKTDKFWESDDFQNPLEDVVVASSSEILDDKDVPVKRRKESRDVASSSSSVSGGSGDWEGIHPLMIDHVIEKILDCSENFVATAKQFRLVCKQWREIATKKYRANQGRICFENDFNRKTSKFIQVMQSSSDMPFDKFRFSGGFVVYKPYQGHYQFDRIFNELFRTCVPWMKSLEFTSHNPSDLKFPKNVYKYDLSHLSSLSFHICVFYSNLQMEMTDYLGAIFNAAKNLTNVDFRLVSADPSLQSESQLQVMHKFGEVIATKIPKTCKHLKLNMLISEKHIQLLQERGLDKLECLIIDFQKVVICTKVLESFLASVSSSLQHLEFIEAPLNSRMEFPVLPNLTYLKIEGKPKFPTFRFETTFPNLKCMEILFYWIYQEEDWLKNILVDTGQSKSVSDVEFQCEINEDDVFMFHRIVRCFPKMRRLSVVINSTVALTNLLSTMTFLEDLEISLAREFWEYKTPGRLGKVDQAFCGIPADLCVKLLRENDFSNTELPETLKQPSIRDMKNLRKLKIRGYRADQIPLTDVTIHYGLLKMKKLTHLTLDTFPVSKQCLSVLKERVNLRLLPGPPTLP